MSKSRLAKRVKLDVGSPFDIAAQENSGYFRRGHNVNQNRGDRKAEEGAMKAQIRGKYVSWDEPAVDTSRHLVDASR
jgi:hypothetical protein